MGTYLEIVPSLKKPIKVFEIEHFGAFVYVDIIFPIILNEIRKKQVFICWHQQKYIYA